MDEKESAEKISQVTKQLSSLFPTSGFVVLILSTERGTATRYASNVKRTEAVMAMLELISTDSFIRPTTLPDPSNN